MDATPAKHIRGPNTLWFGPLQLWSQIRIYLTARDGLWWSRVIKIPAHIKHFQRKGWVKTEANFRVMKELLQRLTSLRMHAISCSGDCGDICKFCLSLWLKAISMFASPRNLSSALQSSFYRSIFPPFAVKAGCRKKSLNYNLFVLADFIIAF